ncbi:MAG TPA: AAA family ATPase [Betaproteobacteria bacterium]|nr:AAA family ATPase [Betaproteobacteria bacterium]
MDRLAQLLNRAHGLLDRLETGLTTSAAPAWDASPAFRWRRRGDVGFLQPIAHLHRIQLDELYGIDAQKAQIDRNTRQFVTGLPANNVLLTGARGTGKSSLVKAVLNQYAARGLRLIEVDKHRLGDLADIVDQLHDRPERFIVFCDDLSFKAGEPGTTSLKAVLDGSIAAIGDNMLVYATSNRRHLMPDEMADNLETRYVGEEVHPGEAVEEKVSLSERFGLWLSFYPFDQEAYLAIVDVWLKTFKAPAADTAEVHRAALQWALARGSRSGRVAWQFARDWTGRRQLNKAEKRRCKND